MNVCLLCVLCVVSSSLCDGPFARPEESYRVCVCVCVCVSQRVIKYIINLYT
jgi:hypothetical protein